MANNWKNAATAGDVVDTVKAARMVKQTFGRSSLTRSARDTIKQFPTIFSADIPMDDAVIIAKALEAQYAALLVSVISCHSDYDRGRYDSPADYLQTFHNNRNIPSIFLSMENMLPDDITLDMCSLESAMTMYSLEHLVSKDVVMECWGDDNMDQFNGHTLNDVYRPADYTQSVMESISTSLRGIHKTAMEGEMDDILGAIGASPYNGINKDRVGSVPRGATKQTVTDRKEIRDSKGRVVGVNSKVIKEKTIMPQAMTGVQQLARSNDKLTTLEPTLINLQLNSHHGDGPVITHNVVMGVKAMICQIPQNHMVSGLSEGVNESRALFKWVQWSEGTRHFIRDFIFGISNARAEAVGNRDMSGWLRAIQRRKNGDTLGKLATGDGLPPFTTIVCTTYEAAKVMEETGYDLNEAYNAVKLINKYYLLGFMIYDPERGTLKSIFDGDVNYSSSTINGLKTKQQKDTDLTQFTQFVRAAGRM